MKIICPNCGSKDTCRIMYGLPEYTDKLERDLEAGKVHLGGCVIMDGYPNRHCNACGTDYGTTATDNLDDF